MKNHEDLHNPANAANGHARQQPMRREELQPDLEAVIDSLAQSYESPLPINNLDSAGLPNRRAVIEAFLHIAPAIYLGFYSRIPLSEENLRSELSRHVYPAFRKLTQQIERAVTYGERYWGYPTQPAGYAREVTLQLFQELPRLRELLNEDARAAFENDLAAHRIEEVFFSYPTLAAITAHRVAHILYRQGIPMIPRIISEYAHSQTGIDINPGAQIGRRFFIDHGTGVVIGETAILGDDVKLYQGVTLGALSTARPRLDDARYVVKRHPTIGNRVTIYAGATILGGQTVVGDDSVIGGNVWLVNSVPAGSKIFGRAREETPVTLPPPATPPPTDPDPAG